jgi:YggT family protein
LTLTDPPVKLLRRIIPQLTIGAVRFDLSIMVLLLAAFVGMQLAFGAAT